MVVLDWDEDRGYLKLRNDLKCAHDYGVAIYVPIVGTSMEWSNQKLFSSSYKKLGPGEAYEFKAKLPSCGPFQADPTHTLTSAPEKPDFGVDGRYLLNIYAFGDNYGDAGNCNPPAPPPPPTPAPPVPPNPPTPPTPPPTPPAPTCQAIDPVLTKKEALTSTHLEVVITASWKGGLPASLEYSDAPSVRLTVPGTVNRSYIRTSTEQTFTVLLRPETGLATLHCPTSPISIKVPALPPPPPPPPTPVCAGPWVYTGANPFSLPNSGNATELAHVRTYVSSLLVGPVKSENIDSTEWVSDGNYPVVLVKSAQVNWLYTNVTKGQILLSPAANQNGKLQGISHISRFTCP